MSKKPKFVFENKIERLCGNCDFYYPRTLSGKVGECRKNPPVVLAVTYSIEPGFNDWERKTLFPDVEADDWCGEFSR